MIDIIATHPADIAENILKLSKKERNLAFLKLSGDDKTKVFPYFDNDIQIELLKNLGNKETS